MASQAEWCHWSGDMQPPGVGSPSEKLVEARGSWRCFGWDPFAFTKLLHVTLSKHQVPQLGWPYLCVF